MSKYSVAIIDGSKEARELYASLTQTLITPTFISSSCNHKPNEWNDVLAQFDALIVAPHPFAYNDLTGIQDVNIPQIALQRPKWNDDQNIEVETTEDAVAELLKQNANRPLIAVGRQRLNAFVSVPDIYPIVRCRTYPLPDKIRYGELLYQTGPFTIDDEVNFFKEKRIDAIVAHNAGGNGGRPKIDAAHILGIPVILLKRPQCTWNNIVETPDDAIKWLEKTLGLDLL